MGRGVRGIGASALALMVLCQWPAVARADMQPGGAVSKLGRGLINVFTGWEISTCWLTQT